VRALVFVALLAYVVGGAPSFAGAQSSSAWILWEKYYTKKGTAETTTWEPQDGFEQLADCRKSAQQLLQFALDYMKSTGGKLLGPTQLDGRAAMFAVTESGVEKSYDIRYLCFPGTFDPRPRQ
jgi:hypothetical protein